MDHIKQFEANMVALPELCYTVTPEGMLALIERGQMGYRPVHPPQGSTPNEFASKMNVAMGVTAAQERAMLAGSLFGFQLAIANPENHERAAA